MFGKKLMINCLFCTCAIVGTFNALNNNNDYSKKQKNNMITHVRRNVQNECAFSSNNFISLLREHLNERGTSPEEVLENYLVELKDISLQENSDKIDEIEDNIEQLEHHLDVLQKESKDNLTRAATYSATNEGFNPETAIAGSVAYFVSCGYDLAVELLNHSLSKPDEDSFYEPFYGGRVFASPKTISVLNDNILSDSIVFENGEDKLTLENDLYYSLHGCEFKRDSSYSKKIIITDYYDYERKEGDSLEIQAINGIVSAHEVGYLKYFNVKIVADYRNFIPIEVLSKVNNKWNLKIKNTSSSNRVISYNSKMASKADARNWTNLTDIEVLNMSPNSEAYISISENGTATHFAFSYRSLMYRYTTMAEQISIGNYIGVETYEDYCAYQSGYYNLGKSGNSWLLQIANQTNVSKKLEYNTKMCFENDAKNWENLSNIASVVIEPFSFAIIRVYENYFATHIAARLLTDSSEQRLSINNLDVMCNMDVNSKMYDYYEYLQISNLGKVDGKWQIKISNPLSTSITVYYNEKMCNFDDAKNWNNLSDVTSLTLLGNSSDNVSISTNWFATSIAICYINSAGYRLVTYADSLNANGSIAIYNNRI